MEYTDLSIILFMLLHLFVISAVVTMYQYEVWYIVILVPNDEYENRRCRFEFKVDVNMTFIDRKVFF